MSDQRSDIIALCQRLGRAHHDRDARAIVDCYAPGAVIYSLAPPLRDDITLEGIAAWLATWDGPIELDAEEVDLVVGDGIGWSTALNRIYGKKTDGTVEDLWFRTTMCFREFEGGWLIVHDHSSTPFYMDGSYRAAIDLKPDAGQIVPRDPGGPGQ